MKTVSMEAASVHSGELILVNKDYSCRYDGENVKPLSEMKSDSYVIIDYSVGLRFVGNSGLFHFVVLLGKAKQKDYHLLLNMIFQYPLEDFDPLMIC